MRWLGSLRHCRQHLRCKLAAPLLPACCTANFTPATPPSQTYESMLDDSFCLEGVEDARGRWGDQKYFKVPASKGASIARHQAAAGQPHCQWPGLLALTLAMAQLTATSTKPPPTF